jgi:hypothetical protein
MRAKEFMELNGIVRRTPLVKVFQDIFTTDRYNDVFMDYLDGKWNNFGHDMTVQELRRFSFVITLLNTLFNYRVDFSSPRLCDVKWRLEYAISLGLVSKEALEKYLKEWEIYEDYMNLESRKNERVTDILIQGLS